MQDQASHLPGVATPSAPKGASRQSTPQRLGKLSRAIADAENPRKQKRKRAATIDDLFTDAAASPDKAKHPYFPATILAKSLLIPPNGAVAVLPPSSLLPPMM